MKKIYDKVSKQWIPVGDEFYKQYSRQIGLFINKEQRNNHCVCPISKWWLCDCDCQMCEFYVGDVSLDEPVNEDDLSLLDLLSSNSPSTENIIEDNELVNGLWKELSELSDEDFQMCRFLANNTQTETAKKMGITRDTLRWRWKKVQKRLAKKLKNFF